MKKTLKTWAAFALVAPLLFAGCKKEKIEPVTPEEETVENIFANTSWTAQLENTYYYREGGANLRMDLTMDISLDFLDSVNAELFQDLYVYVPDYPSASQSANMTSTLTYTYDGGDSVMLYGSYVDEETGDTLDYSYRLDYNKDAQTLTLDFGDEDMVEMMGTSVVTFTKSEDTTEEVAKSGAAFREEGVRWNKLVGRIARAIRR